MLLPVVTDAIKQSPKHIAGISFSDRSIRFVEVERHKEGLLTLSSFGQITVPYDVMKQGKVVNMIEFTEVVRKLNASLSEDTRIIVRKDGDPHKIEAILFAGYSDIHVKEGIDSLRGVFVPWQTDAKRICLFANYDTTYVLEVTGYETKVLEKMTKQDIFSPRTGQILRAHLETVSDKKVLLAGKYENDAYIEQLEAYGLDIEETTIWQNLFDFTRYIPEIPQDESYQYTVPAGLVVAGLMGDVQKIGAEHYAQTRTVRKTTTGSADQAILQKDNPGGEQREPKDLTERDEDKRGGLADFLVDVQPLTKLEEDKRKNSEKKLSRKYSRLLN